MCQPLCSCSQLYVDPNVGLCVTQDCAGPLFILLAAYLSKVYYYLQFIDEKIKIHRN